jgi:hypothetical protein
LLHLSVPEVLNYGYAFMVRHMDVEARRKFEDMLRPAPVATRQVDDLLPAQMRGAKRPDWWRADADPFSDMHRIG